MAAVAGTLDRSEISYDAMIRLMVGRQLKAPYIPPAAPPGDAALEVVEARTETYPGQTVSLTVRYGEIFGLAGLVGSGRTELVRAVFGIDRLAGGIVRLDGQPIPVSSPRDAIDAWHLSRARGSQAMRIARWTAHRPEHFAG